MATEAVGRLCETYWAPANAYVRRWATDGIDGDDLTQQFFARFLQKQQYRKADRHRGRFRTFLLTSLKNFLINERERATAAKRGGGRVSVSLDELAEADGHAPIEPADLRTAERAYEKKWALTLLEHVRKRLLSEFAVDGRADRFAQLEQFLPGENDELTYAEAAQRLGIPEGTIKSEVHRLKRRYRELLREEIAHTVPTASDIDDELAHLITVLSQPGG